MVLLNGVKYACETCIRGHRASSCTHTDKPLTMIKPKGRPASQCTHCREQRKVANVHNLCNCGKKGKSPGHHLSSCLCHKTSHCTCSNKDKKASVKKPPKTSTEDIVHADSIKSEFSRSISPISENVEIYNRPSVPAAKKTSGLLMDDMAMPFEASNGLLDYLSSSDADGAHRDSAFDLRPSNSGHSEPFVIGEEDLALQQNQQPFNSFAQPPTDAELDLMENMFPLFPLVGSHSFEKDQSLPLSGLHDTNSFAHHEDPGMSNETSDLSAENSSSSHLPLSHDATYSHGHSSTYHPRPMKPALSSSAANNSFRPRRAESVLSVTSTSSNTSRHNLFDTPQSNHHHFPKGNTSAAFPPFNLSQNNSHDDLSPLIYNTNDTFNENRPSSILSDFEVFRNGHNGTPQSASPSRRTSQTRRKASLQRSHSNLYKASTSKDPLISSLKTQLSSDTISHPKVYNEVDEQFYQEEPFVQKGFQRPAEGLSTFAQSDSNITAESFDQGYQSEMNSGYQAAELKKYEDFLQGLL